MTKRLYIGNGIVKTMGQEGTLDKGGVLIEDGLIKAVGSDIDVPKDSYRVDAKGGYIMPGIIDAHCHIGIYGTGTGPAGVDGNELNVALTPQMRAIDGIYPLDPEFLRSRQNGVTMAATGPGSANPIGGQFAVVHTCGDTVEEMLVKTPAAMKIAFGENPKNCHGNNGRLPGTRMGVAALIREKLYQACEYSHKLECFGGKPDKKPAFDLGLEALIPVIKGELLVKAHAHRADDIMTAIRIGEEFNLKMTIEHCSEGHLIANQLAAKGKMVILGPYTGFPHKNEIINLTEEAAGILEKAGVKLAIMSDLPSMHTENLRICAGVCFRKGLSEEGAFEAITIRAAQSIGMDESYGSLEAGKVADVAVFDKNPVRELDAQCICTVIKGGIVHNTAVITN